MYRYDRLYKFIIKYIGYYESSSPQNAQDSQGCRIPAHYIPTPQFPRFPKNSDFRPKLRTGFSMVVFAIFAERPYPQKFSKFDFALFS